MIGIGYEGAALGISGQNRCICLMFEGENRFLIFFC